MARWLLVVPLLFAGCDDVDKLNPLTNNNRGDTTDATSGDSGSAGDTGSSADTGPAPLNASVTMTAMIRSVTANGQVFVEGNFTWNATGVPNLRVDIQVKNAVAYPDWTTLLANQDPVDVGTASINGPDQMWNFRAVAYLASDPSNTVMSAIDTIP